MAGSDIKNDSSVRRKQKRREKIRRGRKWGR